MKFRCRRCQGEVTVPSTLVATLETAVVSCPGCGAKYRRRVGAPPPSETSPGVTQLRTSPGQTASGARATAAPPSSLISAELDAGQTLRTGAPSLAVLTGASPSEHGFTASSLEPAAASVDSSFAQPPANDHAFRAGDLLAQRYGIVRFIARGGMGEVYEAEDLELSEKVALKTVLTKGRRHSQGAIERLKREIQLARKVTHPNVCRIFDVGRHEPADGGPPVTFLTMEYLEGTTLARRLREQSGMGTPVALPLVCQMAEALHAAHRVGIVHRDFKSDNVMLVEGLDGPRAVVTDFGIARATRDSRDAHLTNAGELVGTPAYMAPEQITGGEITGKADLYALGIVMFEMVTGRVPFLGDSAITTAAMRLTSDPPSPRDYAPDLDPKWEAAILRCLEREPKARFANGLELVTFLRGEEVKTEEELRAMEAEKQRAVQAERQRAEQARAQTRAVQEKSRRGYRLRLVLALVLVLAMGVLVYQRVTQKLAETPTIAGVSLGNVHARRAVAVLGFNNVSGRPEADWLSVALAEMLATELATGNQLRIVPGSNVARARLELELAETDSLEPDKLKLLGSNLGTDYVVTGSYVALPQGELRVDMRLQNAGNGDVVAAVAQSGSESKLFDLVAAAGEQLRKQLSIDSAARSTRTNPMPGNREAARLYSEGIEQLRLFDPLGARELLEQAAAIEPANALIQSALATALSSLGYESEALAASQRAFDLSDSLPDEDRLLIEGQYRERGAQWHRAAEVYRTLWSASPDNLEYGLRLVAALTAEGQGDEALAVVDALRRLPEPAAADPRVDLADAAAAAAISQLRRQQMAASQARLKARDLGARLLQAQAGATEAEALRQLGKPEQARQACDEALAIYTALGHRSGQALVLAEQANILFSTGDYESAAGLYQQSLDAYQEVGDQSGVMRAVNNMAVVLRIQGRLDQARERYEQLLAVARRVDSTIAQSSALNNLGAVLFSEGRLGDARQRFEEALELNRRLGQRDAEASAIANIAAVHRWQGALDEAQRLQEQALSIRRDIGQVPGQAASLLQLATLRLDRGALTEARTLLDEARRLAEPAGLQSLLADHLHTLGVLEAAAGNAAEARRLLDRARATREQLGDRANAAASRLELARLDFDEGELARAAGAALTLAGDLAEPVAAREEVLATALLAEAMLGQGRPQDAESIVTAGLRRIAGNENVVARLRMLLAQSRLQIAQRRFREAETLLADLVEQADQSGFVELALRARLALAELAAARGQGEAAERELAAVRKTSEETGMALFRSLADRQQVTRR